MSIRARKTTDGTVMFWCPGCKSYHGVATDPNHRNRATGALWQWNGSLERPTFTPSVLVNPHEKLRQHPPEGLAGEELRQFCDANRVMTPRCHSFVREGRIEFLSDCDHELAGQTVDLTDDEE